MPRLLSFLVFALLQAGAAEAAELSRQQFLEQFLIALQAKDAEKTGLLLQSNPTTAHETQQFLQKIKGEGENAQEARAIGELLGKLLEADKNSIPELDQLLAQGMKAARRSDYRTAQYLWEQGLSRARELDNSLYINQFINNLGVVYKNIGQYTKALEYYEQVLVFCQKQDDKKHEGDVLSNIGVVYRNLGQYAKSLEYYQQALTIAKLYNL